MHISPIDFPEFFQSAKTVIDNLPTTVPTRKSFSQTEKEKNRRIILSTLISVKTGGALKYDLSKCNNMFHNSLQGMLQDPLRYQFKLSVKNLFTQCRAEFPDLFFGDFIQALLNFTTISALQSLIKGEVEFTTPVFSFSMLYPLSDNLIDDILMMHEEKAECLNEISLAISGMQVSSLNEAKQHIFSLINSILETYPRDSFPKVEESLYQMLDAQKKSIMVQHSPLSSDELLSIAIEKGGSSLIVDALLVDGDLPDRLYMPLILFGYVLQSIDDLEDFDSDLKKNHRTYVNCSEQLELDTNRLFHLLSYIQVVFKEEFALKHAIIDIIDEVLFYYIAATVFKNRKHYSNEYLSKLEHQFPLEGSFIEKLYHRITTFRNSNNYSVIERLLSQRD